MNRALQESNWQEFIEVEKILNGDDAFWGLNEDQVVGGGLMKSGHTFFCDELQAVLNSGGASQSQSESCYSIQRTLSCPIAGDVAGVGSSQRKRKAETLKEEVDVKMEKKKMKVYEEEESKFSEQNSNCNSKSTTTAADSCRKHPAASKSDSNSKGGDAPKTDYVHVRARRGQATDSHSLAERVRREKISERMKFLQDLVPGCDKITGKAAMLDEIINYVQSLQRQVELLSMKLAALTPRLNHDMEGNLPKEIYQSILPSSEVNNSGVHFHLHPVVQMPMGVTVNTSDSGLHGGLSVPLTIPDPFIDSHAQQFSWGNEMENPFASSFLPRTFTGEGFMGAGNVKLEMP